MSRTVTFSVDTKYEDRIEETFTFEQLGLDENTAIETVNKEIEEIFKAWVSYQLNISYSIMIDTDNK
ncbi:hypothetical protein AAGS61_08220 [Lysinibacillus sp. KU-BSD001]|uniref:hypothetical protein n=1 Tax=Lysinibacillus sp. KU-BSD001 TaxID=3141328 RepID=UPI0036EF5C78